MTSGGSEPGDGQDQSAHGLPFAWALRAALAVSLFVMMLLTFVDVVGRYGFNAPLAGAKELTELLMMVLVFGAAPLVTWHREHITTALFDDAMSRPVRRVRDISVSLFGAAACATLAWRIWVQADMIAALDTTTPLVGVPLSPFAYFMAVMAAACAVILLAMAVRDTATWRTGATRRSIA